MPLPFVILHHSFPENHERKSHFDLMLQDDRILKTWELLEDPIQKKKQTIQSLFDHRIKYLQYEGLISDDRGEVSRWDEGTYQTEERNTQQWQIIVESKRLSGTILLQVINLDENSWSFEYSPKSKQN